jgi:hypothetical protein
VPGDTWPSQTDPIHSSQVQANDPRGYKDQIQRKRAIIVEQDWWY